MNVTIFRSFYPVLQACGASNIVNNWPQLVEQAQLMVMMLDSNPVPSTFAESITAEFVNVYGDYCATQRTMCDTLVKVIFKNTVESWLPKDTSTFDFSARFSIFRQLSVRELDYVQVKKICRFKLQLVGS